jgi:hypothetical protein
MNYGILPSKCLDGRYTDPFRKLQMPARPDMKVAAANAGFTPAGIENISPKSSITDEEID